MCRKTRAWRWICWRLAGSFNLMDYNARGITSQTTLALACGLKMGKRKMLFSVLRIMI